MYFFVFQVSSFESYCSVCVRTGE